MVAAADTNAPAGIDPVRESGVRRVFLYLSIFFAAAITGVIMEEADMPLHLLDDVALVALSLVAIALIAMRWKLTSPADLRKTNNWVVVLFGIALVFQLFGVAVEYNDPADFGNDIPSLIGVVLVIVNRFA